MLQCWLKPLPDDVETSRRTEDSGDSDTMHIKNENTATRRIHDARFMDDDYVVEFSANGVANVKQDVGEALAQSDDYSGITEHNGDDDE